MSQSTEQNTIQNAAQLCIKCKQMYGHKNFQFMCSKCFKNTKMANENIQKKEKLETIPKSIRKNTQSQEIEKTEKVQQKEYESPRKKQTEKNPVQKTQRQRTREKQQKKNINKCFTCNKKTGNLGHQCRYCVNNFCKLHRLPEEHKCSVDFVSAGKKLLSEANPEIKTRKLSQIQ